MKLIILLVLLIGAIAARGAEGVPNTVRWITSPNSNSITAARWPYNWKSPFAISTNTPAFETFGLELMLKEANTMREKWHLDIPETLALENVFFAVFPAAKGIEGHLMTRNRRFHWVFSANTLCSFEDRQYFSPSFLHQDDESARLAKIKSQISKKEAEDIARQALSQLVGMTEKQLKMKNSVKISQYKFEENDGTVYMLPLFDVRWRMAGSKQFAAGNLEYTPLYFEISGITKKVAKYEHPQRLNENCPIPRPSLPVNYFQMLGLADSFLETVPARKRSLWGLPPLTNAASQTTDTSK